MDERRRGFYKHTVNPAKFIARFRNIDWLQPSVIAIIVANLAPVVALFVFHWDAFSLLFLFWLENVIIGVFNVLKMLLAGVGAKDLPRFGWVIFGGLKLFLIPFFCVHYGMFTFVHGVFIVGLFNKDAMHQFGGLNPQLIFQVIHENHLEWPFIALVVSHAISFVGDYLWTGEFRRTNPADLMTQPYRRVILMHVTVILGAFLAIALHAPEAALILLVVLKTATDLWGHQNVREQVDAGKIVSPGIATTASPPSIQTAFQAAWQARAAQTGKTAQADNPIPFKVIAIFLCVILLFFGLMAYTVYDFVRPFFGRSTPMSAVQKPASVSKPVPGWTLAANHSWISEKPAAGSFLGSTFHANRGVLAGEVLTLSDTTGETNRAFVIHFTPEQMGAMGNRIFQIATNDATSVPEVKLVSHEKKASDAITQTFTNSYAMQWSFGIRSKNKVPLKIYLCLPDAQKSFVVGTFKVTIKKEKTASDTASN